MAIFTAEQSSDFASLVSYARAQVASTDFEDARGNAQQALDMVLSTGWSDNVAEGRQASRLVRKATDGLFLSSRTS